ncbi:MULTISPECIES: type II toxin-antitoxin system RelB family antitoxin [Gemella]|jgi:hypothetical protein|uniref:type II toxin-antitoxin system RelB family antitoxin n=1 Tax=Gemella TaxID=1378 RepID=UPI00319E8AA2
MTTLTVRLNQEEEKIFNSVANLYGGKLSTAIKQLALEKIEDEYDMQLIKDFEEREERNEVNLISFDELKKELEI